jgi:hypothetical protein
VRRGAARPEGSSSIDIAWAIIVIRAKSALCRGVKNERDIHVAEALRRGSTSNRL